MEKTCGFCVHFKFCLFHGILFNPQYCQRYELDKEKMKKCKDCLCLSCISIECSGCDDCTGAIKSKAECKDEFTPIELE